MQVLYKLRDYKETFKFEKEHPKELRWDSRYKLYMLQEEDNIQGIWLKDKSDVVGEILLSWKSSNVAYVNSFTVIPTHRGQGYGYELVKLAIDWALEAGFDVLTGEARKGPCWAIYEDFGAIPILDYKDWSSTKEDYIFFKIEL
jgi:GNAT superfamily N-acetyltransferase